MANPAETSDGRRVVGRLVKPGPLVGLVTWFLVATAAVVAADPRGVVDIGSRRELMIDNFLVDRMVGRASHRLHHPVRREIAIVHDSPWEGNGGNYHTVFYDKDFRGGRYRMYYHAWHIPADGNQSHPLYIAYAESKDGIHWEKPNLGLFEHNGSKQNSIVLATINVVGGFLVTNRMLAMFKRAKRRDAPPPQATRS